MTADRIAQSLRAPSQTTLTRILDRAVCVGYTAADLDLDASEVFDDRLKFQGVDPGGSPDSWADQAGCAQGSMSNPPARRLASSFPAGVPSQRTLFPVRGTTADEIDLDFSDIVLPVIFYYAPAVASPGRPKTSEEQRRRGAALGRNLKTHRIRKFPSLSEADFAAEVGISVNTLRKIENSTPNPGFFAVDDLARALGLNLDQLASDARGAE